MPQIDLSPLSKPPSKDRPARKESFSPPAWKDPQFYIPAKPPSRFEVTVAQITNVAFVLAACLGAVVSALYFIKGGELFQEVAAWPRELFYGRPGIRAPAMVETAPETDTMKDPGGDPFSSTGKLLKLNSATPSFGPNRRSSSPFGASDQALNRLNMPAPGGDVLSRGLMQGAATPNAAAAGTSADSTAAQSATTNVSSKPGALVKTAAPKIKSATARATTRERSVNRSAPAQKNLNFAKQAKSTVHLGSSQNASTGNHNSTGSSHIGQSAASLRSIAPATHPFGGAAGGMGMRAGQSLGRAGGR